MIENIAVNDDYGFKKHIHFSIMLKQTRKNQQNKDKIRTVIQLFTAYEV